MSSRLYLQDDDDTIIEWINEGKGWKKFQSYKGEGALPQEADRLRVCVIPDSSLFG